MKKKQGDPLWTQSPGMSGTENIHDKDYPQDVKDMYRRDNLNEQEK